MHQFSKIEPNAFDEVFHKIGKQWMLITACGKDENGQDVTNTMTASWGGMGILWNKPVAFCFIRPQRYTYTLTEQAERFSLSFLDETYRAALRLCGSTSGKNTDKIAAAGLTCHVIDGVPTIAEATQILICRKLYADDLRANAFCLPQLLDNYQENDFHRMYVLEIEQILQKNS